MSDQSTPVDMSSSQHDEIPARHANDTSIIADDFEVISRNIESMEQVSRSDAHFSYLHSMCGNANTPHGNSPINSAWSEFRAPNSLSQPPAKLTPWPSMGTSPVPVLASTPIMHGSVQGSVQGTSAVTGLPAASSLPADAPHSLQDVLSAQASAINLIEQSLQSIQSIEQQQAQTQEKERRLKEVEASLATQAKELAAQMTLNQQLEKRLNEVMSLSHCAVSPPLCPPSLPPAVSIPSTFERLDSITADSAPNSMDAVLLCHSTDIDEVVVREGVISIASEKEQDDESLTPQASLEMHTPQASLGMRELEEWKGQAEKEKKELEEWKEQAEKEKKELEEWKEQAEKEKKMKELEEWKGQAEKEKKELEEWKKQAEKEKEQAEKKMKELEKWKEQAEKEKKELEEWKEQAEKKMKELEEWKEQAEKEMKELEKEKEQTDKEKKELEETVDKLRTDLSEMAARLSQEHDLREKTEEQMKQLKGDGSMLNEQSLLDNLRVSVEHNEFLQQQLDAVKKELDETKDNLTSAVEEAGNNRAIIEAMQDDHTDGTRLLAEREQKIRRLNDIIQMFEAQQRGEVNFS